MTSYKIIVKGKVQGVFYRKTIKENALKHRFNGFVKNLPNGNVEVGVMLDESNYDFFIKLLKKGSPQSMVTTLKVEKSHEIYKNFEIRY